VGSESLRCVTASAILLNILMKGCPSSSSIQNHLSVFRKRHIRHVSFVRTARSLSSTFTKRERTRSNIHPRWKMRLIAYLQIYASGACKFLTSPKSRCRNSRLTIWLLRFSKTLPVRCKMTTLITGS
jgi:hypothetical protein